MPEQYQELWTAGIVLAVTVVLTAAIRIFGPRLANRISRHPSIAWYSDVVRALIAPAVVLVFVSGISLAVLQISTLENYHGKVVRIEQVLITAVLFWALLNFANTIARRRIEKAIEGEAPATAQYLNVFRKLINIFIVVLAIITIIGQLDYKITPLLTGLGIGGLAVALALQDTLSNVFAGFYMMMDQPLKVGDYVKLNSGEEGFVEEIGWRNTKIRPWANNMIIIPNSVLSQTIITNHFLPVQELSVYIPVGVSYYSDLDHVEQVTLEVANQVMSEVDGTAPEWEPVVRFNNLGDSNVEFNVVLRVIDFSQQYVLRSTFIKALFRRYREEGIEISFPMRKIEISTLPEIHMDRAASFGPGPKQ